MKPSRLTYLVLCLAVAPTAATPSAAQTIGLVPNGTEDVLDLFKPGAMWPEAASHVSGFGISVSALAQRSDRDVRQILDGLRRLHIAAGLDMLPLSGEYSGSAKPCGFHVEGYSAPGQMALDARWFKAHNGDPDSYGMDEPLLYGHYYNGPNACRSSIAAIARDVAGKVRQVEAVFPNVKVGDTEPIMSLPEDTWQSDITQWLDDYQAFTGKPLAFFSVELDWNAPWRQRMPLLKALLQRKQVPLVVIYNANGDPPSDAAWAAETAAHYKAFETSVGVPDGVAFQSWVHHPTRLLPESDPTTFTGMIVQYLASRASRH